MNHISPLEHLALAVGKRGRADCVRVYELGVSQIQDVIRIELVVSLAADRSFDGHPSWPIDKAVIRYLRRICPFGITHPYPNEQVAFGYRVCRYPCRRRDGLATVRIEYALTGSIEPKAVIRACDSVVDELPPLQRREAMRAPPSDGRDPLFCIAKQHNG